uniref:Putative tick transposon n=1 Tax=Ixodes ricinus TaxID=34613 RepID=A0A6B0UB96_IXORI
MTKQLVQLHTLLQFLSFILGPLMCSSNRPYHGILYINAIVAATCKAKQFGYAVRHGILPPKVDALFGLMGASSRHVKRVCTILRSEAWS